MPVEIDELKPTSIFIAVSQSVNFTIGTYNTSTRQLATAQMSTVTSLCTYTVITSYNVHCTTCDGRHRVSFAEIFGTES